MRRWKGNINTNFKYTKKREAEDLMTPVYRSKEYSDLADVVIDIPVAPKLGKFLGC